MRFHKNTYLYIIMLKYNFFNLINNGKKHLYRSTMFIILYKDIFQYYVRDVKELEYFKQHF